MTDNPPPGPDPKDSSMAPEVSDAAIHADPARRTPADDDNKPINWFEEIRGLFLLLLAVLAFHSLVAKPFYIPTMSMMPNLLVGDRLVVSKYPYGWSWVSVSFHLLPPMKGRINGSTPEYGDIVIATPEGASADYIKRVIGRPGDTIEVQSGRVILNGEEIVRAVQPNLLLPVDLNSPCNASDFPMLKMRGADGRFYCELPIIRETLPNGVSYNTIDLGPDYPLDNYGPYTVPAGHVFLMGDNRDRSADSRASREELGLGGAVPLENIGGRAEIVTFSLDGNTNWNPLSWWESLRGERAGNSLRADKD